MAREVCLVDGTGRGSAPSVLPGRRLDGDLDELDRELLDLLCDDRAWLEEMFREIVATCGDEPPRGGADRLAARPRRYGAPGARRARRTAVAQSQWFALPTGRERSPPGQDQAG